jgi:ferric-dicitrate binding protein FerR (iron transport regulator)
LNRDPEILVDLPLIGRYLAGEASPEEAFMVDNWRESDENNNALFESAARLWDQSCSSGTYHDPDDSLEWLKLKTTLRLKPEASSTHRHRRRFLSWKVAAGLLLLIGASLLGYRLLPRKAPHGMVITTGENIVTDTLKDLSSITLARHSRLSVDPQFAVSGRKASLDGEGYFSVKPLPGQPFIIYTGGIRIIVLGTTFNVKNDSAAVTVSVGSGAVRMYRDTSVILITTGSTGVYDKQDNTLHLYRDSLNRNSYGYATEALYFHNMPLGQAKEVLESVYNVRVLFDDPLLAKYRINTKFNKAPLQYVLDVISASLDIRYKIENKTVYFFDDGHP